MKGGEAKRGREETREKGEKRGNENEKEKT